MSTDRDVERIVRSWLDEGVTQLPDRVLDLVLDQVPATPQRRAGWLARRFPPMNTATRVALAAVVVAVLAFVGIRFLLPVTNIGADTTTASPTPSPVVLDSSDLDRPVAGGRYAFELGPTATGDYLVVALTLPAGWSPRDLNLNEGVSFSGPNGNGESLGFYLVQRVYLDPCHPEDGYAGSYLGSSNATDVASELRTLIGFNAGPASDVQIAGLAATRFVLSNSIDTDTAGCTDGGLLPLFITWEADKNAELLARQKSPATNGGTEHELWVVDRKGTFDPLLIVSDGPMGSAATRAVIEEIISSITLGRKAS